MVKDTIKSLVLCSEILYQTHQEILRLENSFVQHELESESILIVTKSTKIHCN